MRNDNEQKIPDKAMQPQLIRNAGDDSFLPGPLYGGREQRPLKQLRFGEKRVDGAKLIHGILRRDNPEFGLKTASANARA